MMKMLTCLYKIAQNYIHMCMCQKFRSNLIDGLRDTYMLELLIDVINRKKE